MVVNVVTLFSSGPARSYSGDRAEFDKCIEPRL